MTEIDTTEESKKPALASLSLVALESVRVMRLEPGDVLILKMLTPASNDMIDYLREQVVSCFPGYSCLVLNYEMNLEIGRPAKEASALPTASRPETQ